MVCTLALDARQTLKLWQPLALLFHIMNLDFLWVRKRCLNISAIGGDILSLSLDFWPFRWMFDPKMIFPKYACLWPPKSWWLLWQGCFGDFFGGEETFYVWPIAFIKPLTNFSSTFQHWATRSGRQATWTMIIPADFLRRCPKKQIGVCKRAPHNSRDERSNTTKYHKGHPGHSHQGHRDQNGHILPTGWRFPHKSTEENGHQMVIMEPSTCNGLMSDAARVISLKP